ncbi:MAG: recombinase family protein [Chromatiaceae bacterium]|jgi:DNA invertase Pin-like site-specific DNA recombinase
MALIACYCRVSTRHQKNDSQRAEIERWLRNNQVDLFAVRWFEDKESATAPHQPAFEAMQAGIFDDTIKTVVIWKLDRLSRRLRDGINLLADWCERGVRVVAVTQQIDLSGTVGHMVASVMFGLAEIELEYRRERQAAGIAVAKRKGVYKGRRSGTTKARPARAQELHANGLTVPEIANAMAVSERTVFRYLNETK